MHLKTTAARPLRPLPDAQMQDRHCPIQCFLRTRELEVPVFPDISRLSDSSKPTVNVQNLASDKI